MGAYTDVATEWEVLARPWPRFWARLLDVTLYGLPIGFLLGAMFPSFFASEIFNSRSGEYFAGMIILPFSLIVDAFVLSLTGSSPGKALAGIYLASDDHEKVQLGTSLFRNLFVYAQGLVLGIPLLVLIGYSSAYNSLKNDGATGWDKATGTRVYAGANNTTRTVLTGIIGFGVYALSNALPRLVQP